MTINEPTKKYTRFVGEYTKNSDLLYQKQKKIFLKNFYVFFRLTKLNRQLFMSFDHISVTLYQMNEVFQALYNNIKSFNENVDDTKNSKLEDVYLAMNNIVADWGLIN